MKKVPRGWVHGCLVWILLSWSAAAPVSAQDPAASATRDDLHRLMRLVDDRPETALRQLATLPMPDADHADARMRYGLVRLAADLALGRLGAARQTVSELDEIAAPSLAPATLIHFWLYRAQLAVPDDREAALALLEKAQPRLATVADGAGQVAVLNHAAAVALALADTRQALKWLKDARRVALSEDDALLQIQTYQWLGRVYAARGDVSLALDAFQKGLALSAVAPNVLGRFPLLVDQAHFLQNRDEHKQAVAAFREALRYAADRHPAQVCPVYLGLAESLFKMNDNQAALAAVAQAREPARAVGLVALEQRAWGLSARVLAAMGRFEEALQAQQRSSTLKDLEDALWRQNQQKETARRVLAETERYAREQAALERRVAELSRQRAYSRYISLVVGVALIAALILLRHYRNSQQNLLKQERVTVEKLRQVDRLKDEFLANTSHELRTPLNGIVGLTESLLAGAAGQLNQGLAHNLSMIAYSGRRLANLINDILDFSQLRNKNLTLVRKGVDVQVIADLVLTLSRPLVKDKKLMLVNDIEASVYFADADENRLQQIFYNLIGNAVKFTDEGMVRISAQHQGNQILVRVDDTGIGIAEKDYERVFHSFEQLDGATNRGHGGAGLGLAVTRRLVRLHGGDIRVVRKPSAGACFEFSLPTWQGEVEPQSMAVKNIITQIQMPVIDAPMIPEALPGNIPAESFCIMIADDDPINRQVLVNHLSLERFQMLEMSDGLAVLNAFAEDRPCDLLLLDIMMPKVSGYEVCRRLRERFSVSELPIIFITARNQLPNLETGFQVGGNDYVIKPVSQNELILRVRTHLSLLQRNRNLEQLVAERTAELDAKNQALQDANARLERISTTDPLTGMGNRRYLRHFLDKELSRLSRARQQGDTGPRNLSLVFLLIDLDHFKQVNDRHGHEAGDRVLAQMRPLMEKAAREEDLLIRWGGEEFLIVGRQTDAEGAAAMAERLCHLVAEHPFDIGNKTLNLTCSIGFAGYPFLANDLTQSWEQSVRFADAGLYAAKNAGRNRWVGLSAGPALRADFLPRLAAALDDDPQALAEKGLIVLRKGD